MFRLAEKVLLRTVMRMALPVFGLPDRVLRPLVGRPIRIDGHELSTTGQVLVRLEPFVRRNAPGRGADLNRAREDFDITTAALLSGVGRRVTTHEVTVQGASGPLTARVYVPPDGSAPASTLVYFHGGGFVLGSVDSHDGICRFLAERAEMRVVSVDYRLAPEHPFPAPVDDAAAAFHHVVREPHKFGAEPGMIGIGGDSAGATLSALVAQTAAAQGLPTPAFSLLLYPATDASRAHRSRKTLGDGFLIETKVVDWFESSYVPRTELLGDPRVSPLSASSFAGVPPTCVVTGGFDPFRDEGEEYARRMLDAGVDVTYRCYSGLLHGFASYLTIDRQARQAMHEVAEWLRHAASPLAVRRDAAA